MMEDDGDSDADERMRGRIILMMMMMMMIMMISPIIRKRDVKIAVVIFDAGDNDNEYNHEEIIMVKIMTLIMHC